MTAKRARIYTRTGDRGETGLVGGDRVPKDSPRIEAFGDLDELSCAVGVTLAELQAAASAAPPGARSEAAAGLTAIADELVHVQRTLFEFGASLATPASARKDTTPAPGADDVTRLERAIDRWSELIPPLQHFIFPGGARPGALLHLTRAVCRRAERDVLRLHRESSVGATELVYLNRLSDFLFVAARYANWLMGVEETRWTP